MNEYKIAISANDPYGAAFLKTVVGFANKGAVIDEAHSWTCKFPAKVYMNIKTEEYLETDILNGVQVFPIHITYTKEMLDDLSWNDFKEVVRKGGVTKARDRTVMTNEYLRNVETLRNVASSTSEPEQPVIEM